MSSANDAAVSVAVEEQVACRFCKYLLQGAPLGDCRVTRWIGSGAFGDVYEAVQSPPLSRHVAIKVMSLDRVADEEAGELFAREVGAIAALDHPNILPVLRADILEDGRSYLVMKYAAHDSLQKFCQTVPQQLSIVPTITPTGEAISKETTPQPVSGETVIMVDQAQDEALDGIDHQDELDESRTVDLEVSTSSEVELLAAPLPESVADQETITGEPLNDEDVSEQPAEQLQDTATSALDEQDSQETRASIPSPAAEPQLLTAQQLLPYVESAAAALHYAHEHNLIHLDVKPANLLLDGNDHLMLADFGVSAIMDGYTHASLHCYVGTPAYTAPEQWLEQPRPASDQYALAVTCYQLLTGHLPFTGNLYSIMHGHLRTPPPPLRQWNPYIPEQVESVILRALAKESTERYRDMLAFAAAYRDAVEQAANAQTDVQGRKRTAILAGRGRNQAIEELPTVHYPLPDSKARTVKKGASEAEVAPNSFDQVASIDDEVVPYRDRGKLPTPPPRKRWGRLLLFLLLAFLLVGGGTLGTLRVLNPCLMGVCPGLKVSQTVVDMTNSASQAVKITNTGTTDLHWSATLLSTASWLQYTPSNGILMAGKTAALTIKTDASQLKNGFDSTVLEVGGQGVNAQRITINLTVQTGLSLISATDSGHAFVFDQSGLHPGAQTITITNNSNQSFNWYISYQYVNSWLQVSPEQGTVPAGGKSTVKVTANLQSLLPLPSKAETYLAGFTILGNLDQADPGILSEFNFTLEVKPVPPTVTPPITVTVTPQTPAFPPLTLNAQPAPSINAPVIDRSGHNMVWDATDDLFYVFGGIDSAGNLLNDLWSYNPLTGQWLQINSPTSASGTCANGTWPAPRMNAAMVWDSVHQQILLYGGIGANNRFLGDLWSYSPSSGAGNWTPIACSGNGPGGRAANAVWNGNQMLLVGGLDKYGPLADFWSYTPNPGSVGSWQRLGDFPAGPRAYQTLVWDTTDSQLFAFGGLDLSLTQRNDFYSYSTSAGWKLITPASTSNPSARQQGMGVWDSKDDKLLLIGGWNDNDPKGPYWGLWAYDPGTRLWDLLTPLDNANNHIIPGRTDSVMVWDAREQEAFIYAGAGNGKSGSTLNDLWMVTSG
jgi:serine/threonine protein kinase